MTSTQCTYIQYPLSHTQSQYTSYAPHTQTRTCSDPSNSSLRHTNPERGTTPATAHSGTYIHTNPSVEDSSNSSLRHIYTHKPKRGETPATAHSGTQTLSVELPQQQFTQAHIYTNPERGAAPATAHPGTYIHTNPSVERLQQQLTQAHILSVGASSNSSLRHIYTHKP